MPDRINKTVVILRTFFSFICPQHFMPVNRPSSAKGIRSRVVWQCNSKFKNKTRCKTPHLTEDEVKAAFIRLVNKLSTDREFYVTELTAIKDRLGDNGAGEGAKDSGRAAGHRRQSGQRPDCPECTGGPKPDRVQRALRRTGQPVRRNRTQA